MARLFDSKLDIDPRATSVQIENSKRFKLLTNVVML